MNHVAKVEKMPEIRWCGEEYPNWHADDEGRVYKNGVEVAPYPIYRGHRYYRVRENGKDIKVHTLVCTAFHGPRPPGNECRHLNDVKTDNRAENLCWGTMAENQRDAVINGVNRSLPGEKHGMAKLTDDAVRTIRRIYAGGGISQQKLADIYGITQRQISNIVRHETWKHLTDEKLPRVANF